MDISGPLTCDDFIRIVTMHDFKFVKWQLAQNNRSSIIYSVERQIKNVITKRIKPKRRRFVKLFELNNFVTLLHVLVAQIVKLKIFCIYMVRMGNYGWEHKIKIM
jgi:hypothetical protein